MALTNTKTNWGAIARFFHWTMALLIILMLVAGTVMVDWPNEEFQTKFQLYQLHKSFGFVVAGFLVLRLLWRLVQPVPVMPAGTSSLTRRASQVSHALLYVLMLAIPLTGYLMVSASTLGVPTLIFGALEVPHLIAPDAALEHFFKDAHDVLGKALVVVVVVHILAALKHALIDGDSIWTRMARGTARA